MDAADQWEGELAQRSEIGDGDDPCCAARGLRDVGARHGNGRERCRPVGSQPGSTVSQPDPELVGTWEATEAMVGHRQNRADANTYEYLLLEAGGSARIYEGDDVDRWHWSSSEGRLILRRTGSGSSSLTLLSHEEVQISEAIDEILDGRHGTRYRVASDRLTLSGTRSRIDPREILRHPHATPHPTRPALPIRVTFRRLDGPPPSMSTAEHGPDPSRTSSSPAG